LSQKRIEESLAARLGIFFALVKRRESEVKQGGGSLNNFPAGEMLDPVAQVDVPRRAR